VLAVKYERERENVAYRISFNRANVREIKMLENTYLKLDASGKIKSVRLSPYCKQTWEQLK
jgi:hypothetical protein